MSTRIDRRFSALRVEGRAALVTFLTAGDPDQATSLALLQALPSAGATRSSSGCRLPIHGGWPRHSALIQRALKRGQHLGQNARSGTHVSEER